MLTTSALSPVGFSTDADAFAQGYETEAKSSSRLFFGVFTARLTQHALRTGRASEQHSLGEGWPSGLR